MKLSIVIVNYNVQYFLRNCLLSVIEACKDIEAEIIVVDNRSTDGSVEMLKTHFPEIKCIANTDNLGFSKANNQAIQQAFGEYVLLLNPDTVVEEDTFRRCIEFMDVHRDCGGLGVRMIDGSGTFLPESKRGLPKPNVAFYKIFGLAQLFPKSKKFGQYHLGYLSETETAEIEILSGAYMFLRKSVIDEVGMLDESFFMYGEDIDLSYRIIKGGYKNYYFPEVSIIHYKGESTKKSSVNYVFVFYKAMVIFARKHFSKQRARMFSFIINVAIYFRAFIAIIQRFVRKVALPCMDFGILYVSMFYLKEVYEKKVKYIEGGQFPEDVIGYSLLGMSVILIMTNGLFGAYRKPNRINKLLRGISAGVLTILIVYALLNESVRFSRMLVLALGLSAFVTLPVSRVLLTIVGLYKIQKPVTKKIAIVGNPVEVNRVEQLLKATMMTAGIVKIDPAEKPNGNYYAGYLGYFNQLWDCCEIHHISEIIFCSKDIRFSSIIAFMARRRGKIDYKIAPPESEYIIGSSSNETAGEYYVVGARSIIQAGNKRKKRGFDLILSFICLLLSPFILVFFAHPSSLIINLWNIFVNRLSFVGLPNTYRNKNEYRNLKPGVIDLEDVYSKVEQKENQQINSYVRNYSVFKDLEIVLKGFGRLDKRTRKQ
jgi:GT2 family glycosyltransferase